MNEKAPIKDEVDILRRAFDVAAELATGVQAENTPDDTFRKAGDMFRRALR